MLDSLDIVRNLVVHIFIIIDLFSFCVVISIRYLSSNIIDHRLINDHMATLMNMEYKRLDIFKDSVPDKHVRILTDVEDSMVPLPDVEVNELTVNNL